MPGRPNQNWDNTVNSPEIDRLFDKLRKAGNGAVIKLDTSNKGAIVEGVIFEPSAGRPPGFESGIFVKVPSEESKIYYLDPEASREQGRIIMQMLEVKKNPPPETVPEDFLREFEHLQTASDVKRGGGATNEARSKATGTIDLA
jgi:hypothetical protein